MAAEPTLLSLDEYRKLLAVKLETSDFEIVSIEETTPEDRVGFLGDHTFVRVRVRGKASTTEVKLFAKTLPQNVNCRLLAEESRVFEKEAAFYNAVSRDMNRALEGRALTYPEPLAVKSDLVLLEDMRPLGYSAMAGSAVDRPHAEQALAALARFHGASLLTERRTGKSLKQMHPDAMFESIYVTEGRWARWADGGLRAMRSLIPLLPQFEGRPEAARRVQDRFQVEDIKRFMTEFIERNSDTACVLCHGDSWIGNFIFKYGEDKQPVQAMLVDFQLIRYAPPAYDVSLFLAKSLAHDESRARLAAELQRFYHACLAEELRLGGVDVEAVLPWEDFARSCRAYAVLLGLLVGLYSHLLDAPPALVHAVHHPTDTALYEQYMLRDRSDKCRELFAEDAHFRAATVRHMTDVLSLLLGEETL